MMINKVLSIKITALIILASFTFAAIAPPASALRIPVNGEKTHRQKKVIVNRVLNLIKGKNPLSAKEIAFINNENPDILIINEKSKNFRITSFAKIGDIRGKIYELNGEFQGCQYALVAKNRPQFNDIISKIRNKITVLSFLGLATGALILNVKSSSAKTPISPEYNISYKAKQNKSDSVKVIDNIGSYYLKYQDNIIETSEKRSVHILTDISAPSLNKTIHWKWSKEGDSWTTKQWDGGEETIDLSEDIDNSIFRFAISGTPYAVYKIIFEDAQGRRIEFLSTENLGTLYAEQYSLIRLDALRDRDPSFNWNAVRPPIFEAVSSEADVFITNIEILNVKAARERGISIGLFYHTDEIPGNDFYPHEGYAGSAIPGGRAPASVLSFSSLLHRDPYEMLGLWNNLLSGQVPHEVLEIWPPSEGSSTKSAKDKDGYLELLRKNALEIKARILLGEKIDTKSLKSAAGESVFKRVISGEFDDHFVQRALAAKEYNKPVLLRFFHEMMGGWYPWSIYNEDDVKDFIEAWKHVVRIYRQNGATNVAFGLSPHTYEPDYLPQTRKFQTLDNILWHLLNDEEKPFVDFVGIDAYSYPPEGGYFNQLTTDCFETVKKHNIPVIMGEMSSAMSTEDKYKFWNYLRTDLKNGMFPELDITIFSIAKEENGSLKDFHPPEALMNEWGTDDFFAPNTYKDLPGKGSNRNSAIPETTLPREIPRMANWVVNGESSQRFTVLPGGEFEECFWQKWNENTYCGNGVDLKPFELTDDNYSDFEFIIPLQVFEGEFHFIFEDDTNWPGVGNQISLDSETLQDYIVDGELIMSIDDIVKFGALELHDGPFLYDKFHWGNLMQVKFELQGQRGRLLKGMPAIRKIIATAIEDVKEISEELNQVFPNPFGHTGTTIRYSVAKPSKNVKIEIFDAYGQLIRILQADGTIGAHTVKWDGLSVSGNPITGGTYFIRINNNGKPGPATKVIKIGNPIGMLNFLRNDL
ncbi:MAG: T9SS type A sorting domain-containing protein [Candidatus Omnitrophica bacterium]|nr:T9SS type A sorting domain-containing protein [Candidatus Omnitrophota bacterium]